MKKIAQKSKSFFALALVAAMLLSCNVNAFAAERDGSESSKSTVTTVVTQEEGLDDNAAVLLDGNVNDQIATCSTNYISHSGSNLSLNSKYSDNFTMSRTEKLYVRMNVQGSCHIKVTFKKWGVWSTFLDTDVTNTSSLWYSPNTVGQGITVYVTVTAKQSGSSYSLSMYGQ